MSSDKFPNCFTNHLVSFVEVERVYIHIITLWRFFLLNLVGEYELNITTKQALGLVVGYRVIAVKMNPMSHISKIEQEL